MPRITLYGFYNYDPSLFDNITLPTGIDKDILLSYIMRNSGDLYPYHQVPEILKRDITFWFASRLFEFTRILKSLRADYSPIENYNRTESIVRDYSNSGQDEETVTLGSTSTTSNTGNDSDETMVSAYNEDSYTNRDKKTTYYNSGTETKGSGSDSNVTKYGMKRNEKENINAHGNIGVTSNQSMIRQELDIRMEFDIYKIISMEFEREFLVQVY